MRHFIVAGLLALVAAAPANEKRQLEELTSLLGGGAAAAPDAQNNAAADPITALVGGNNPLAGILKTRQLDEITSLLGGAGGANPLSAVTGGAAAPAADAPAGQKAAETDLLADFTKAGLPIPRRRSRRQLEQITALLGKGKGKGNAKTAKAADPLAALTGALASAKGAKGNAKGKDPLAALGAIARKRALIKRRAAIVARDIEDDEDGLVARDIEDDEDGLVARDLEDDEDALKKRSAFIPGQGQPLPQSQGQPIQAAGPTSDVNTILGVLSLGGPSGALTQNSGVGPILANDPSLAGLNTNGLQPLGNGNPNLNGVPGIIGQPGQIGQNGQNGQQVGSGITLALSDPNVARIGQPSLISNSPPDLGALQGAGIVL